MDVDRIPAALRPGTAFQYVERRSATLKQQLSTVKVRSWLTWMGSTPYLWAFIGGSLGGVLLVVLAIMLMRKLMQQRQGSDATGSYVKVDQDVADANATATQSNSSGSDTDAEVTSSSSGGSDTDAVVDLNKADEDAAGGICCQRLVQWRDSLLHLPAKVRSRIPNDWQLLAKIWMSAAFQVIDVGSDLFAIIDMLSTPHGLGYGLSNLFAIVVLAPMCTWLSHRHAAAESLVLPLPVLVGLHAFQVLPVVLAVWATVKVFKTSGIGDAGIKQIAKAMPRCSHLQTIGLRNTGITNVGAWYIAEALPKCSALQVVNLGGNRGITDERQQKVKDLVERECPHVKVEIW